MDQQQPARNCPKCGSADYQFRGRKKMPAESGQEGEEVVETKYRCKGCSHEWKVRTPERGG